MASSKALIHWMVCARRGQQRFIQTRPPQSLQRIRACNVMRAECPRKLTSFSCSISLSLCRVRRNSEQWKLRQTQCPDSLSRLPDMKLELSRTKAADSNIPRSSSFIAAGSSDRRMPPSKVIRLEGYFSACIQRDLNDANFRRDTYKR